jgi:hypothetical protein
MRGLRRRVDTADPRTPNQCPTRSEEIDELEIVDLSLPDDLEELQRSRERKEENEDCVEISDVRPIALLPPRARRGVFRESSAGRACLRPSVDAVAAVDMPHRRWCSLTRSRCTGKRR